MRNKKLFQETVKLITDRYGLNIDPTVSLDISYLPEELKRHIEEYAIPEPKQCYKDVMRIMDMLRNLCHIPFPLGYILGFTEVANVPIEHCILQIGDHYYDPTLEFQNHPVDTSYFIPVRSISESYAFVIRFRKRSPMGKKTGE